MKVALCVVGRCQKPRLNCAMCNRDRRLAVLENGIPRLGSDFFFFRSGSPPRFRSESRKTEISGIRQRATSSGVRTVRTRLRTRFVGERVPTLRHWQLKQKSSLASWRIKKGCNPFGFDLQVNVLQYLGKCLERPVIGFGNYP